MKTQRLVDEFMDHCRYRDLSPATLTGYRWALGKLQGTHEKLPRKPDVLMRLITFEDLASESKHDLWRAYRRFYRWASTHHAVPNAMEHVPPPRVRRRLPRTLEASEIDLLVARTDGRREKAMVSVLLDTGIRVGELAGLRWEHVKAGAIQVDGKTGQRTVPMSAHVRQLLVGLGDPVHLWTGRVGPLTRSGVEQVVRRALRRGGYRPPKAGPHMLRHTFGRHYIMAGGDVFSLQRIMGHQNVKTTMLYVHLNDSDLQVQHAKYSPLRSLDLEPAAAQERKEMAL